MRNFLSEFEKFVCRGNVLDLAVAVIIGASFTNIVNSLVKDVVNPILGVLVGRPDFMNLFIVLKEVPGYDGPRTYEALTKAGATLFGYGAFLTAVVQFLLLAFVVFWLVKIVTGARARIEAEAKRVLSKLEIDKAAADAVAKKAEEEARAALEAKAREEALAKEAATTKASAEELELLREIRDLLKREAAKS